MGVAALLLAVLAGAVPTDTHRSVAVFPFSAKEPVLPSTTEVLTNDAIFELRGSGAFLRVVGPAEIATLIGTVEQQQLLKCVSDECAMVDSDMVGALGVTHLMVGSAARVGNTSFLQLRLIDVKTALEAAAVSERVTGQGEEALIKVLPGAVRSLLVRARFLEASAPPPQDAEGTTLKPVLLGGTTVTTALALASFVAGLALTAASFGVLMLIRTPAVLAMLQTPMLTRTPRLVALYSMPAGLAGLAATSVVVGSAALAATVLMVMALARA
ncbi:MAG: hypothetical protein AB2A00_36655 [Myxococcota bacterium]